MCVCSDDVAEGQRSLIKDHVGIVPYEVEDANHSLFNCDLLTLSFLSCVLVIVLYSLPDPVGSWRVQSITRPSASVIRTHINTHAHTH